jgi:hypothetical protein
MDLTFPEPPADTLTEPATEVVEPVEIPMPLTLPVNPPPPRPVDPFALTSVSTPQETPVTTTEPAADTVEIPDAALPSILDDAAALIREEGASPRSGSQGRIAGLWSAFLGVNITADEVTMLQALVKIADTAA